MNHYEQAYAWLVEEILEAGEWREGRNGRTKALFGKTIAIDMTDTNLFPLLCGRKLYYKGVFGELAAMLRGPKHLDDFKKFGCNYWEKWCNADGSINVDYGNSWRDYNGVDQLEQLTQRLRNSPHDRRLMVTGWRPDRLDDLSLPCCHHTYQWFVREGGYLDMLWMQRSVDTMIGLPSDVIFAAAWNIMIANEVGLSPGKITFSLGDTHIYEEHIDKAYQYLEVWNARQDRKYPSYALNTWKKLPHIQFIPDHIRLEGYEPCQAINFELKA